MLHAVNAGNDSSRQVKPQLLFAKNQNIYESSMVTIQARTKTFDGWPYEHIQKAALLADAGFYATKDRDLVHCFYCGILIGYWTPDDIPVVEHLKFSRECTYINLNKTRLESEPGLQKSVMCDIDRINLNESCSVCRLHEANFVVLPCSHLATCLSCVSTLDKCVICREEITQILKIFIV